MKHHVCAVLLFMSSLLCAEVDKNVIADKSQRIGRFSYEDSFDENLVEEVLKHSPAAVKKNINTLLYPSADVEGISQRLLLLGGTSNASTTAIAKSIALRCGYDYYVIEASALLQDYREGRQMLLPEVRPIIKRGKPIALIITELPEMADYSGLLASTLWMLIDQCEQYPDVLVIGTSACKKGQLSEDVKERFGENIISVSLNQSLQDQIETKEIRKSWFEKHKIGCAVVGGAACLTLATVHVVSQILFATIKAERETKEIDQRLSIMTNFYNQFFNASELYIYHALHRSGVSYVSEKDGSILSPSEIYDKYKNGKIDIPRKS
jgi:hypothetical protein